MNKHTHTPGPLGIGPLTVGGPDSHDSHIPIIGRSTIRIADVYARLDTHPEICPAEAMANAILFQNASRLLDALKAIAETEPNNETDHSQLTGLFIAIARTAVSQATRLYNDVEPFTPAKIIIKTGAISSECTPETAQALVEALKSDGWPVSYGGRGNGSILPNTLDFANAFYEALAEITGIP